MHIFYFRNIPHYQKGLEVVRTLDIDRYTVNEKGLMISTEFLDDEEWELMRQVSIDEQI